VAKRCTAAFWPALDPVQSSNLGALTPYPNWLRATCPTPRSHHGPRRPEPARSIWRARATGRGVKNVAFCLWKSLQRPAKMVGAGYGGPTRIRGASVYYPFMAFLSRGLVIAVQAWGARVTSRGSRGSDRGSSSAGDQVAEFSGARNWRTTATSSCRSCDTSSVSPSSRNAP
jgi:hypothetical protein